MIGLALSLEVLSYYVHFSVFWPLFLLCFTAVLVCFSVNTYFNGMYSLFGRSVKKLFKEWDMAVLRPQRRNKFILTLTVIGVNCAMAVFFSVKRGGRGISRYLLFIFMANMIVYVVYYIAMKGYLRFVSCLFLPAARSLVIGPSFPNVRIFPKEIYQQLVGF